MPPAEDHPTVIRVREAAKVTRAKTSADKIPALDEASLRDLCLEAGADDCGFVSIDDPALDDQRQIILTAYPFARTLISFVKRMHYKNVRSPMRSYANLEFHATGDEVGSDEPQGSHQRTAKTSDRVRALLCCVMAQSMCPVTAKK